MNHPTMPESKGDRPRPDLKSILASGDPEVRTAVRKLQAILAGQVTTDEEAAVWDAQEARRVEELHAEAEGLIRGFMGRLTQPYEVIEPQGVEWKNMNDDDGGTAVTLYSAKHDITIIVEAMAKRVAPEDVEEMPPEHWVGDPRVTPQDIAGFNHTVIAFFFRGRYAPEDESFDGVSTVFDDFKRHIGELRLDTTGQDVDNGRQTTELSAWCRPEGSEYPLRGIEPEVIKTLTAWSEELEVLKPDGQLPGAVGERALGQTVDRPDR